MSDRPDEKVRVTSESAPAPTEVTREHPGRYDLRSDLAQGGQSKVHVAYDRHLGREVAFKQPVLPETGPPQGASSAVQRFLREARITAQLEHPNIVAVYEIGSREDGSLYCTQKLVRPDTVGSAPRTLATALREAPALRERLAFLPHFTNLCNALAYTHSKGVVHRDVKPDNVVLGSFGETVLLDWGLAKVSGESDVWPDPLPASPNVSMIGVALGTPGYMSPEQAAGNNEGIDERSDVWSLGVILYQMLAGRRPAGIPQEEPAPLADVAPAAPPELAAIAMKALARNPADRYPDAKALAADVTAWQTGERVAVYDYSVLDAVRLFVSRHRTASAVAAVAFLLLAVAGGMLWESWRQSQRNLGKARHNLSIALVQMAQDAETAYQWDRAAALYAAARVQEDRPEAWWGAALAGTRELPAITRLPADGAVLALAYAKDGSLAAAGTGAGVRLWSPERAPRGVLPHEGAVGGIALSPDGSLALSAGHDGRLLAWEPRGKAEPRLVYQNIDSLNAVILAPDGRTAAIAAENDLVVLLDALTGKVHAKLTDGTTQSDRMGPAHSLAFSRDGRLLFAGTWDNGVRVWDVKTGALVHRLETSMGGVRGSASVFAMAVSPDGEMLVTAGRDRTLRLWNIADWSFIRRIEGHGSKVYAVAFSPDGSKIVSGGSDQTVRMWDAKSGQPLVGASFGFAEGDVMALAFAPDGKSIAFAGSEGAVWVRATPATPAAEATERIYALAFSPDGKLLAHAEQGMLLLRDAATFEERHRYDGDFGALQMDAAFSPDGRALAVVCHAFDACLIDTTTGEEIRRLRADEKHVQSVAWSPDATILAAAGIEGVVRLFSTADGTPRGELKGHVDALFDVEFSPDGTLLATASYDKTVRLWSAKTGAPVAVLGGHADGVRRVEFSPDGRLLASASWDMTVRVWDVEKRAQRFKIEGHDDYVFDAAFSPDGKWLATASWDGTLRVWDTADGKELARFVSDEERIYSVVVAPDGKSVAYAGMRPHMLELEAPDAPREHLVRVLGATGLRIEEDGLRLVRTR